MFRKKPMVVALSTALILALSLVGCGTKPADTAGPKEDVKPIIVKFAHVVTPDTPKGQAALKFKELAEQKTNGKVVVEVYPSSQLYGDKEELEAAQSGNVHIIAPSVTKLVGLNPKFQYTDLPFLFPDNEAVYKFFKSDSMKGLMNSLDKFNLQGVAVWPNGFKHFTNNKRPLVAPADFVGLKFRTQAGKVLEAQFKALGAGSATIPFGETYSALQQGTVDGQENTYNNIDTQKYQETQSHLTVTNHGRIDYMIIVNKSFWAGLEPDIRRALDEAMAEATIFAVEQAELLDEESKKNLINGGKMKFTELTPAQMQVFRDAMKPVYEEFESVLTKELIDEALKAGQK